MESNVPWLSLVVWLPLAGALALLAFPRNEVSRIRYFANAWAILCVVVSLPLAGYDATLGGIQFIEDHQWIPLLGARYTIGVDGISAALVLLTTLLGAIATLSSWNAIAKREKEFYVFVLLMQTTTLGVFASMDLFLFYVFWEVSLVPMYFLIAMWGGERSLHAAIKFFLYTLVGSVVMLLAIFKLYFLTTDPATAANIAAVRAAADTLVGANESMKAMLAGPLTAMQTGQPTFNVMALQALGGARLADGMPVIPLALQIWLFAGFFVGFAFKVPMFPFHTWLPDAHVEAPTAGSVILAGVLLKLGGYGFLRFSLPMLPDASRDPAVVQIVAALAIVGIVYGALCSLYFVVTSGDMKKLVAYSSVSHMGMVMLGVFALNPTGIAGGAMQMVNHGISTSGLFLVVGLLYERRRTRLISDYSGLTHAMPGFATVFLILVLSSIGLPMLNGFVGEFLALRGAFEASPWWAGAGVLGIVLGAAYSLWLYQRLMFGPVDERNSGVADLTRREWAYLLPLVALAFWIGVYPKPVLDFVARPAQMIAYQVWNQAGDEVRYAPTPEEQERLATERANRARSRPAPAADELPVPDEPPAPEATP